MNYLAHVALAEASDEARLGALLGDFARGLDVAALPLAARRGLEEHRAADVWFDAQPEVRAARARFPPELRRVAGILVDVFLDHVLVRHWPRLCPAHLAGAPLAEVTTSLYRALERHAALLPPRLAHVAPAMARDDWLASYGALENVERALAGLARRLRRPTPLASGIAVLRADLAAFEALGFDVFPRAVEWARAGRASAPGE